jgi:hypothetical protein
MAIACYSSLMAEHRPYTPEAFHLHRQNFRTAEVIEHATKRNFAEDECRT